MLKQLGVSVMDASGAYRNLNDILADVQKAEKGMTDSQKEAVAYQAAGIRQANIFATAVDTVGRAQTLTNAAMSSSGELYNANAKYMDTTAAKLKVLSATMSTLWQNTISSNFVNSFISSLNILVNGFSKVSSTFGILPTIIGTATFALALFNKELGTTIIDKIIAGIKALGTAFDGEAVSAGVARIATAALEASLTMGLSLAITAIIGGISDLINVSENQAKSFNDLTNSVSNLKGEISNTQQLISTYKDLSSQVNLTNDQKQKLAQTMQQLQQLYPASVEQINSEGQATKIDTQAIEGYVKAKQDQLKIQQQELANKFYENGNDNLNSLTSEQQQVESLTKQLKEYETERDKAFKSGQWDLQSDYTALIDQTTKQLTDLQNKMKQTSGEFSTEFSAMLQQSQKFSSLGSQNINNFVNNLTQNLNKIKGLNTQDLFNISDSDKFISTLKQADEQIQKMSQDQNLSAQDIQGFQTQYEQLFASIADGYTNNSQLAKQFAQVVVEGMTQSVNATTKQSKATFDSGVAMQQLTDNYKTAYTTVSNYAKIQQEINDGHKVTTSQVKDLIDVDSSFSQVLENQNGTLVVNQQKLEELIKSKKLDAETTLNIAEKVIPTLKQQLSSLIPAYSDQINAINNVKDAEILAAKVRIQAIKEVNDYLNANATTMTGDERAARQSSASLFGFGQGADSTYRQTLDALDQLQSAYNFQGTEDAYKNLLNTSNYGANLNDNSSSASSTSNQKNLTDSVTSAYQQQDQTLKGLDDTIKQIQANRDKLTQGSVTYRDSLHQENEALRQEDAYIQQQIQSTQDLINTQQLVTQTTGKNGGVSSVPYADEINQLAQQYNIPANIIAGMVETESSFNPNANNGSHFGLMQLSSDVMSEEGVSNAFDPTQNLEGGVAYLAKRIQEAGGNLYAGIKGFGEGTDEYLQKVLNNAQKYGDIIAGSTKNVGDASQHLADFESKLASNKAQEQKNSNAWGQDWYTQLNNIISYATSTVSNLKTHIDSLNSALKTFTDSSAPGYAQTLQDINDSNAQATSIIQQQIQAIEQQAQSYTYDSQEIQKAVDAIAKLQITQLEIQQNEVLANIDNQINSVTAQQKTYDDAQKDTLTTLQQQLKTMEQQYSTQDALYNLQQEQDKINKEEADARYTYISSTGTIEHTYNRAQVQADQNTLAHDTLKYQEDQQKQVLQDQIDALQNQTTQQDDQYQKQIQDLKNNENNIKAIYQVQIADLQNYASSQKATLNGIVSAFQQAEATIQQAVAAAQSAVSRAGGGVSGSASSSSSSSSSSSVDPNGSWVGSSPSWGSNSSMSASETAAAISRAMGTSSSGVTKLAEGGIVTKPTVALVAEAGEPEFVIPQSKLSSIINSFLGTSKFNLTSMMSPTNVMKTPSLSLPTLNQSSQQFQSVDQSVHYHINVDTVQTSDFDNFIKQMHFMVNT